MLSDTSDKDEFWKSPMSKVPSDNMLAKRFLTGFLSCERLYLHEMANVPVGESKTILLKLILILATLEKIKNG